MTDQAPELLPDIVERLRNKSFAGTWEDRDQAAAEIERLRALTRPTPAERPVPQVREALIKKLGKHGDCFTPCACSESYQGPCAILADEIIALLTARPSDAAVAWPSRDAIANIIEDNIYRKPNGNWDGDFQDLLVAADEIRALPPDEPARESGLTIEHRLQAVRATAIEECAKIAETTRWDNPSRIASDIRALEPARVTPSTVGGEVTKDELWSAIRQRDANINAAFATVKTLMKRDPAVYNIEEELCRILTVLSSPTIASEKECGKAEIELLRNQLAKAQAALRDIGKDGPIWRAQRIAREALVTPAASLNAKETS